jgi:hypothetical protein
MIYLFILNQNCHPNLCREFMSILRQEILSIAMTIKIVCSQIWIKIILCLKKKKKPIHVVALKILKSFWIILILVLVRICHLPKRLTFVHFTLPFLVNIKKPV